MLAGAFMTSSTIFVICTMSRTRVSISDSCCLQYFMNRSTVYRSRTPLTPTMLCNTASEKRA